MQIEEIQVSYSRRIQLEQFEPVEYAETITASLDPEDDPDECSRELADLAEEYVEREVMARIMAKKMKDSRADEDEE